MEVKAKKVLTPEELEAQKALRLKLLNGEIVADAKLKSVVGCLAVDAVGPQEAQGTEGDDDYIPAMPAHYCIRIPATIDITNTAPSGTGRSLSATFRHEVSRYDKLPMFVVGPDGQPREKLFGSFNINLTLS